MLQQITWHQYLTAILLLALIYYAVIILRYCRPEIQRLISQLQGNTENNRQPDVLQYQAEDDSPVQDVKHPAPIDEYAEQQEGINEYDHLSGELKVCIARAADKPFAPAILIPQLKKILQIPREGIASTDRDAINELIVNECEKTGTALLTEDEVDQWWSS
jgi:hypothetical protein